MRVEEAIRALLRYRWITLAVALMIVAACGYVARIPPVYWAHIEVRLLPPAGGGMTEDSVRLIEAAGVIADSMRPPSRKLSQTAGVVPIVERGILEGESVTLPNTGGQWVVSYSEPTLDVQVSGRSEADVRQRLDQVVTRIRGNIAELEDARAVAPENRIRLRASPVDPTISVYRVPRVQVSLILGAVVGLGWTMLAMLIRRRSLRRGGGTHA